MVSTQEEGGLAPSYEILLIDDDPGVLGTLSLALSDDGHKITTARTGKVGLKSARQRSFDVLIVDIGLPDLSGLEVVAELRSLGDMSPVIFLTARSSEEDIVRGLDQGADLYIPKPFSIPELKARIRALMRLVSQSNPNEISFGDLKIDQVSKKVTRNGRWIRLTDREFRILAQLVKARGKGVPREEILKKVWGIDFDPGTVTLDVHLSRLRKKLNQHGPQLIQSIRGYGWRLREPGLPTCNARRNQGPENRGLPFD